tara:strand:+ start:157 stop:702 length:546 start_codon:yes stop_codon:yes gene_type:complete
MSSELRVDKIVPVDGVPTGGGGGIIQIQQTLKTDSFNTSSQNLVDITGMSVSITPKFSTSKILVQVHLNFSGDNNMYGHLRLVRNPGDQTLGASTSVTGNQRAGTFGVNTPLNGNGEYKMYSAAFQILDSPATTSALTYKLQVASTNTGGNYFYLNRPPNNDNQPYIIGGHSTITVMEVSA